MSNTIDPYLKSDRKDFEKDTLSDAVLPKEPHNLFESWLKKAIDVEESEAYSMVLSTIQNDVPMSRVLFLRGYRDKKFIFYTNYSSDKAVEMDSNKNVSLNFYWSKLERQVRITGVANKCSSAISDDYYSRRPRESQIGAWSSHQSKELQSREELEERIKYYQKKFEGVKVPRPEHWGGFEVDANKIEFWQGRKNRLHDRICYEREMDDWSMKRLSP